MTTMTDPDPPEEEEDLSDTEGELQDFMGSDESGDGARLHLSEEQTEENDD